MKRDMLRNVAFVVWLIAELFVIRLHGGPPTTTYNEVLLDTPQRLQWSENKAYSGEVSLITAGLYYGQYVSQYDARFAACESKNQNDCQMQLGTNDETAAEAMHLNHKTWKSFSERSTKKFLLWVKENVIAGKIVLMGIYKNQCVFHNSYIPTAGNAEYDHIVPVVGIKTKHSLRDTTKFYDDDVIIFNDNGKYYTPPHIIRSHLFNYTFGSFQASRQQANNRKGVPYYLSNVGVNHGLLISGVKDKNNELIRVQVSTNMSYEHPEISNDSNIRPKAMNITLMITVTNTASEKSTAFTLYKYNSLTKVPDSNFNKYAKNAVKSWNLSIKKGDKHIFTETIQSNKIAVYRCAKARK